jgi:ssDNA-binding Zn-finger/Zn-ribbon topoisomerase 1
MAKNCPECEILEQILADEIKKPTPPKGWLETFPTCGSELPEPQEVKKSWPEEG